MYDIYHYSLQQHSEGITNMLVCWMSELFQFIQKASQISLHGMNYFRNHCMAWIDFNIDQSRQTLGHSSPCNFEGDSKVICCLLATVACKAQWWQMLVQGLTPQLFYKTTTRIRGYFLFLSYDVIFFLWIYFKLIPSIGASHLHVFPYSSDIYFLLTKHRLPSLSLSHYACLQIQYQHSIQYLSWYSEVP